MLAIRFPLRSLVAFSVLLAGSPLFSQASSTTARPAQNPVQPPTQTPAQTAPTPPAATQAQPGATQAAPADLNNPLQPEKQPDLAADRDPIPSPDVVVPQPTTATTGPTAPGPAGQIRKGENGVYTLHEDVDEVLLDCTVIDDKGRPVLDLRKGDFRVWEDNTPQTVTSFVHQDQPVSMGILIDNSGSMLDKRSAVNAAAMKLLTESNPKDAAFVVNFNERAYLDQGFTVDRVALNRGVSHFDSRGTTALYDAVAASADELAHHAKQRKQVLLIITDGADNASRLTLRDAVRRVQGLAGPVVYTIGLLYDSDPKEIDRARNDLETLSNETGGIAYFPRSLDNVDEIASEVARDIRNQYVVGYHSTKSASLGGYRQIHVEAAGPGHKNLSVRTRRGYYAQAGQRKAMDTSADNTTKPQPPQQQ
ncbi:VWA domain-containing protein [Acidobacteria bacterium AB60]|nr:VWA domain-containing protein [Acidobacteria bacterium AB60]